MSEQNVHAPALTVDGFTAALTALGRDGGEPVAESVTCEATINDPRVGRQVVMWIKQCARRTRHESGRCPAHRGRGPFGPGAR